MRWLRRAAWGTLCRGSGPLRPPGRACSRGRRRSSPTPGCERRPRRRPRRGKSREPCTLRSRRMADGNAPATPRLDAHLASNRPPTGRLGMRSAPASPPTHQASKPPQCPTGSPGRTRQAPPRCTACGSSCPPASSCRARMACTTRTRADRRTCRAHKRCTTASPGPHPRTSTRLRGKRSSWRQPCRRHSRGRNLASRSRRPAMARWPGWVRRAHPRARAVAPRSGPGTGCARERAERPTRQPRGRTRRRARRPHPSMSS
mmetsp:Transcript_100128/g.289083  ORF Transcript_100128/g.289083 Transcript_100128/m.289083 type:complete len:260 (+) Transcript_100128:886-1665(+)